MTLYKIKKDNEPNFNNVSVYHLLFEEYFSSQGVVEPWMFTFGQPRRTVCILTMYFPGKYYGKIKKYCLLVTKKLPINLCLTSLDIFIRILSQLQDFSFKHDHFKCLNATGLFFKKAEIWFYLTLEAVWRIRIRNPVTF
jgi:hypothetical protein